MAKGMYLGKAEELVALYLALNPEKNIEEIQIGAKITRYSTANNAVHRLTDKKIIKATSTYVARGNEVKRWSLTPLGIRIVVNHFWGSDPVKLFECLSKHSEVYPELGEELKVYNAIKKASGARSEIVLKNVFWALYGLNLIEFPLELTYSMIQGLLVHELGAEGMKIYLTELGVKHEWLKKQLKNIKN